MVAPLRTVRVALITNRMMHLVFTAERNWMRSMCIGNTACSTPTEPPMPNASHPSLTPALLNAIEEVGDHLEEGTASGRVAAAQTLIEAAITLLHAVARETKDRSSEVYIVDHLSILASDHHGFLTRDDNLDCWQRRLRKAEGLDEDDGDEE
jgi:hypothetical protein